MLVLIEYCFGNEILDFLYALQKILRLLSQIAQMNQVLVSRHKALASKLAD